MKRNIFFNIAGLMFLLFAIVNLTGCSITDPSENFDVVIEGEVEKSVISNQNYTADPVQMTVLQNAQLGGGVPSPHQPKNGGASVTGADVLEAVVEADLGPATRAQAVIMLDYLRNLDVAYDPQFQGTMVNNGASSVTITIYYAYDSGIGISILENTIAKIGDFSIPTGQSRTISTWDDFDTNYLDIDDVRESFIAFNSGNNLYLYVSAESDEDVDVNIQQVDMTFPAVTHIQQQVSPDDLQDYTLESLNNIGLKGTVVNNGGGQINTDFYLSIDELDPDNLDRDRYAAFEIATNGTFNFATDSYFLGTGRDTMMARFTQLFPPNSETLEFTAWFSSSQSIDVTVNDLGIVADARIEVE